jgi:hypothetical protein
MNQTGGLSGPAQGSAIDQSTNWAGLLDDRGVERRNAMVTIA